MATHTRTDTQDTHTQQRLERVVGTKAELSILHTYMRADGMSPTIGMSVDFRRSWRRRRGGARRHADELPVCVTTPGIRRRSGGLRCYPERRTHTRRGEQSSKERQIHSSRRRLRTDGGAVNDKPSRDALTSTNPEATYVCVCVDILAR